MHRVAMLIFSESRTRQDVYEVRKPLQDKETDRFIKALEGDIEFFIPSCKEIRGKADSRLAAQECLGADVSAVILYIPIFINPALVAHTARQIHKPVILMGNRTIGTVSTTAVLAASGSMNQIGLRYRKIPGDISEESTRVELLRFLRAVDVSQGLEGSTFGCIGGRSLGISSGAADPAQWERLFGVDIEHVDQYEIVVRAAEASQDKVDLYKKWVHESYGAVCYKEGRFDEAILERMIRSYLAVKAIIEHYEMDFLGIKCQPEMSNRFVLQCLAVQLLNDPYDAEGPKEPVACACETDHDGALTMQVLKLISGGLPTTLQDVFHITDKEFVAANCGSTASYFAALSDDPKENLHAVHLQPHGFGEAGGASTQFVAAADEFTYARLYRDDVGYTMGILKGRTVDKPRKALEKFSWYRPTSFVEIDIDSDQFMREFGSNHVHAVRGDRVEDLAEFCEVQDIACRVF